MSEIINRHGTSKVPLTVERATAIVGYAENEFAANLQTNDTLTPFIEGGAQSRQEAFHALCIVIADRFRMATEAGVTMCDFDHYVQLSVPIALGIFSDNVSGPENHGKEFSNEAEELLSFVRYLRTLNPTEPDYWPKVYHRLGIRPANQAREAWNRSWKAVAVLAVFGLASSTTRDWALVGSMAFVLVSLAVWGAVGKSAMARWLAEGEKWVYVMGTVGFMGIATASMFDMTAHERMVSVVRMAAFVAVFMAVVMVLVAASMRSCTRDDRKKQMASSVLWAVVSVIVALGLVWLGCFRL